MKTSERPLSDYVEVAHRFRRSVNLDKDYRGKQQNGEYVVTSNTVGAVRRLAEGFPENSPARAWTITGPYGVGKSAFAVFTAHLLCGTDEAGSTAREQLRQAAPDVAAALADQGICQNGSHGFLPVLVTARRAPASQCLAEGLIAALRAQRSPKLKSVARKLETESAAVPGGTPLDTRWVVNAVEKAGRAAREAGHDGVLLIIDELGKFFEYAARYPQQGDVYVLQELAEYTARSQDDRALLLGVLHQSFEEYGRHLDQGTQREWSKIQGRFGDMAFVEPADQVMRMVAMAIRVKDSAWPRGLKAHVERVADAAAQAGICPPGMSPAEFIKTAVAAYPLHPLALAALPHLFKKFAQNERSLFSYLSSLEPFGFQEFIRQRTTSGKAPEFIRLQHLFDYLTSNFGLGLYRQPQALRLLETADVLEAKDSLCQPHRDVIKTVGLLSTLDLFTKLGPSDQMIPLALQDRLEPDRDLQAVLAELRKASVLTYRHYNRSYRIWEGSDVDIDERIAEGRRQTRQALCLADNVRALLPDRPLVARRHSFETGALRSFEVRFVDDIDAVDAALTAAGSQDGKVIVCLAESTAFGEQFRERAAQARSVPNVVFAIPQQIGELRGLVTELGALRWAWDNTPDLRDDRVARREISLRITEGVSSFFCRHPP